MVSYLYFIRHAGSWTIMAPKTEIRNEKRKRTTSMRMLESLESSEAGISGGTLEQGNSHDLALASYNALILATYTILHLYFANQIAFMLACIHVYMARLRHYIIDLVYAIITNEYWQ